MAKKEEGTLSILEKYKKKATTEFESTGIQDIDDIFGGGIDVSGAMYCFWGPKGGGKSSIALQIARNFCSKDKLVFICDAERGLNDNQLKAFGLYEYKEKGNLIILETINFSEVEELLYSKDLATMKPDLFIFDSLTACLVGGRTISIEDNQPGVHAKQEGTILNIAKNLFAELHIPSIWIQQERGNMGGFGFAAPEKKMAGGYAAGHIPDMIVNVRPGSKVKDGEDIIGCEVVITTEKNRYTRPFVPIKKKLIYGIGISKIYDVIDKALQLDIIHQAGSVFTLPNGDKLKGKKRLYEIPEILIDEIEKLCEDKK